MNNESTDLRVLLTLRQPPGVAPLKNEKAGLFCCSQISPLLKNPIKRQKKVTFPFSAMTHGERPLSGQRWGPLMRLVRGFRPERKGVIDWLRQHCVSCTLSITCRSFSSLLSFLLATSDHPFPERSLPSLCPHLTSLLWGWQPGSKGDKQHPSTLHGLHLLEPPFLPPSILNSPLSWLSFLSFVFFSVVFSIAGSAFLCCPPRRAHKCSSAALITVWQTTVEGWRQLLTPVPSSPNSTPCLFSSRSPCCRRGRMSGCEWRLSPASTCFLTKVSCTYQDDGSGFDLAVRDRAVNGK